MSDRSLVAPIALGIALTGWLAYCNNATGNLEMSWKLVANCILRRQSKSHGQYHLWFDVTLVQEWLGFVSTCFSRKMKNGLMKDLMSPQGMLSWRSVQYIYINIIIWCWKYLNFRIYHNCHKWLSMEVKIPKDSVGIVIGRQGANIREIQVELRLPWCEKSPWSRNLSQAKTETRINFKDELETEEYRVAAIRLRRAIG